MFLTGAVCIALGLAAGWTLCPIIKRIWTPSWALYSGGMGAKGRNFYNDLACRYGYEQQAAQIQQLYLDGNKRDAEALVPAELLELTNLIGPQGYVRERLEAFRAAGVTQLNVLPIGPSGLKDVEMVRGWL